MTDNATITQNKYITIKGNFFLALSSFKPFCEVHGR